MKLRLGTKKEGKQDVWIDVVITVLFEDKRYAPKRIAYRHLAGLTGNYWELTPDRVFLKIEGYQESFNYRLDSLRGFSVKTKRSDGVPTHPPHEKEQVDAKG